MRRTARSRARTERTWSLAGTRSAGATSGPCSSWGTCALAGTTGAPAWICTGTTRSHPASRTFPPGLQEGIAARLRPDANRRGEARGEPSGEHEHRPRADVVPPAIVRAGGEEREPPSVHSHRARPVDADQPHVEPPPRQPSPEAP